MRSGEPPANPLLRVLWAGTGVVRRYQPWVRWNTILSMLYAGQVRIHVPDGPLLTVGTMEVDDDPEQGTWVGTLSVLDGTGVAGKALVVDLIMGDQKGRAQLIPEAVNGDMATSRVIGLSAVGAIPE